MKRPLRLVTIILLGTLLLSVPAYVLFQDSLSDPTGRSLRGFVTMLYMPAIWFPVPLAVILITASLVGCRLTPLRGAIFGAFAAVSYVFAISIYVVYLQPNSNFGNSNIFEYMHMRFPFSVPAVLAASIVTGFATWMVSKIVPPD
jgi:hypothetical protein